MPDNKISEYLNASFEQIRSLTDADTVIGNAIITPSGVTVIPVSKVTMGFATGAVDYGAKRLVGNQNSGGGGGTGVSITPIAFLTVGADADIRLIPISGANTGLDRVASLIEHTPELIERIKGSLS